MLPIDAREFGFTGGEPTIYGDRLLNLIRSTDRHLPRTTVHVLSTLQRAGLNAQDTDSSPKLADTVYLYSTAWHRVNL